MNRTLQCANVHSLVRAHSHITPEGVTTACTLPAQNSLKAAASAVLARTLPRTLPAQSNKTACTLPAQNTPECAPIVQSVSSLKTDVSSVWWFVHYVDDEPRETSPPATHAEILERHPDAIAAEPFNQAEPEPARACSTCTHETYRGGCGEPVAAGLSDLPGVIRYHPDQGATCAAWLAVIPADLEARIRAMAERWNYSGDDLALALDGARNDPAGWLQVAEADERGGA